MKIVTRSLFLLFLLIPVGLSGQTEWQLVWSDEFNADGLPDCGARSVPFAGPAKEKGTAAETMSPLRCSGF